MNHTGAGLSGGAGATINQNVKALKSMIDASAKQYAYSTNMYITDAEIKALFAKETGLPAFVDVIQVSPVVRRPTPLSALSGCSHALPNCVGGHILAYPAYCARARTLTPSHPSPPARYVAEVLGPSVKAVSRYISKEVRNAVATKLKMSMKTTLAAKFEGCWASTVWSLP